jgi:hypothetical protein
MVAVGAVTANKNQKEDKQEEREGPLFRTGAHVCGHGLPSQDAIAKNTLYSSAKGALGEPNMQGSTREERPKEIRDKVSIV